VHCSQGNSFIIRELVRRVNNRSDGGTMKDDPMRKPESTSGVSRRDFMKISGVGVALPWVLGPKVVEAAGEEVAVHGPGKVTIELTVNGKKVGAQLEPRIMLLDALRDNFNLTGAKRVCDRGVCGACTVLMDGKTVYGCSVLAIDAQGKNITTIEGLAEGDALTPVMQAFVAHDAQQCGFCTPGFIVATTHFLEQHPNPTAEDIRRGLSGNYCRCGTYNGIRAVALAGKPEGRAS
jgi:xanthine dehydrogenase YagT iron-sulfur-binding subunit